VVVIDQGSLMADDVETVARTVGTIVKAGAGAPPEVVVASGEATVRPSPTEEAVRESLKGSSAFLDAPGAPMGAAEALEILRGNEAVRDALILRMCGAPAAPGCGGSVRAHAESLARTLQKRSEAFLRVVAELVKADGEAGAPAALILITAGPATDRLPGSAVRRLRDTARGTALRVALVHPLRSDGPGRLPAVQAASISKMAAALNANVLTTNDLEGLHATARRMFEALATENGPLRASPSNPAHSDSATTALVERAARHVQEFARRFRIVLATEEYEQQVKSRAGSFGLSGSTSAGIVRERRKLQSEIALVQALDGALWMIARDVLSVDGRPVASRPPLAASIPTDHAENALRYLREVAEQGARFNLGGIRRNLNTPTLALLVASTAYRDRFEFRARSERRGATTLVEFRERSTPTLLQINAAPARSTGRLWIEPASGAIHQTELVLAADGPFGSRAVIVVDYGFNTQVGAWVPLRMEEKYEEPGRENDWIECVATYSNYKQFSVTTRIR
jgi:hypothetical protein